MSAEPEVLCNHASVLRAATTLFHGPRSYGAWTMFVPTYFMSQSDGYIGRSVGSGLDYVCGY